MQSISFSTFRDCTIIVVTFSLYFRVAVTFNILCDHGDLYRDCDHCRQDVQTSILGKNLDLYHMRDFLSLLFQICLKLQYIDQILQFYLFGKNNRRNSNGLTDACYFTHADTFKYVMRANA